MDHSKLVLQPVIMWEMQATPVWGHLLEGTHDLKCAVIKHIKI